MLLDSKTDEELMVLYQTGEERAFALLYKRHSAKIYAYLKSKRLSNEKVLDIFQDVFVKIHKSKHLYNQSLPVLPWIFTITKNTFLDHTRRAKIDLRNVDIAGMEIEAPVEAVTSLPYDAGPFLESLPENQKQAVQLRYIEEKTFDQIAEILKTSPINVRKLVSRGVQRMKELLQKGEKI
jgi:RNA polymerase sigma factor (sigma-70 family)